jgi:hypothetical protein
LGPGSARWRPQDLSFDFDLSAAGALGYLDEGLTGLIAWGEDPAALNPDDHERVVVEHIGDPPTERVVPGVQSPTEPARQPAGRHERRPQLLGRFDHPISEVDDERFTVGPAEARHVVSLAGAIHPRGRLNLTPLLFHLGGKGLAVGTGDVGSTEAELMQGRSQLKA